MIIRGYIRKLFFDAGIVLFLRAMGLCKLSNGIMRIFTDQLNRHIKKEADKHSIPIHFRLTVDGGTNGAKHRYVEKHYAGKYKENGNFVYCIIVDKEPVQTFVFMELTTQNGRTSGHHPFTEKTGAVFCRL